MSDSTNAVCYLYLSRVAEREGHPRAAGRWGRKADRWLKRSLPGFTPTGPVPVVIRFEN